MIEGKVEPTLNKLKGKIQFIDVPPIDKTLTKEGQCADAKAVGDALKEVNTEISDSLKEVNAELSVLHDDIKAVEELQKENKTEVLPDYVNAELDRVSVELYNKMTMGNVAVIGFSTDQHIGRWSTPDNDTVNTFGTLYGLNALRELTKKIPFNAVVLGGDYISGGSVLSIQWETMMVFEALAGAKCPVVGTVGNHDGWQNNGDITDGDIFKSHTASAVINYPQFKNLDTKSANGYIDDTTVNIRYIILDAEPRAAGSTNLMPTITENLTTMLNSMPEGYRAIIFSHKPLNNTLGDNFKDFVDNKSVLEANADKIICCINGHGHLDAAGRSNGVLHIQTTCAGIDRPIDYERTIGTAQETAFDVFLVDQKTNVIHSIRYGAGESRTFAFSGANYTNHLLNAVDENGLAYNNAQCWKADTRLNSSGTEAVANGGEVTGFIPVKQGDKLRFKNISFLYKGEHNDGCYLAMYDASFNCISSNRISSMVGSGYYANYAEFDANSELIAYTVDASNAAYLRFSATEISLESVITINEEITD